MIRILLVGNIGDVHLGGSFLKACQFSSDRIQAEMLDGATGGSSNALWSQFNYHVFGNPFPNSRRFNEELSLRLESFLPDVVICLGGFPISRAVLEKCKRRKVVSCIFLTDDPWNTRLRNKFLFAVLKNYDFVFTPRKSNLNQLQMLGCRNVRYLPFGYDSELFFPVVISQSESRYYQSDVMFAGGGDADRLPYMAALADAGFNVGLYGGYWDRFSETRSFSRGLASVDVLRKAIASCKVALCLVRRANRDGHVMRTFEVPAVGACMLTEDTPEHREIFGHDGQHVVYFKNLEDMVDRCRWLLTHPDDANKLRLSAHRLITNGSNTYGDRLDRMLEIISGKSTFENTVSSGHDRDTQI